MGSIRLLRWTHPAADRGDWFGGCCWSVAAQARDLASPERDPAAPRPVADTFGRPIIFAGGDKLIDLDARIPSCRNSHSWEWAPDNLALTPIARTA